MWWTRVQDGFNVTYTYTVSMANLENIVVCRIRNITVSNLKFLLIYGKILKIPAFCRPVEWSTEFL